MRRAALLAPLALLLIAVLTTGGSGASFTSRSVNTGSSISADWTSPPPSLRLFSQSTDPNGTTGYGVRIGSSPATPAATGLDGTLAADLGRVTSSSSYYHGDTMRRVFSLRADVAMSVVVSISDPSGFIKGIGLVNFGNSNNTSALTRTLGAGARAQVNLAIQTDGLAANRTYTATISLFFWPAGGVQQTLIVPVKVAT